MTYDNDDIKYGEVKDAIKDNPKYVAADGKYTSEVNIDKNKDSKLQYGDVVINVKEADLNFLKKGDIRTYDSAWVGFRVALPEVGGKEINTTSYDIKGTYSLNGGAEKEFFNGKGNDFEATSGDFDGDFIVGVTVDRLQEALKNGDTLTFTYIIKWNIKNTAENATGIFEQKVTINVDTTKLTITDSSEDFDGDATERVLWSPKIAQTYKATLASATPAEENKTTEENKKDDVPKTGEVIYRCLRIRRRQRKRRNSKISNLG